MSEGAWPKFKPSDLPLVLAGPILRRASASEVTVWFATSMSVDIEVRVFDFGAGKARDNAPVLGIGNNVSNKELADSKYSRSYDLRCGHSLHISYLIVKPLDDDYPTDVLLEYDCRIKLRKPLRSDEQAKELGKQRADQVRKWVWYPWVPIKRLALKPGNAFHPDAGKLVSRPSFTIQGEPKKNDPQQLRFLYGSCRKPHGPGGDAMLAGLECLEEHFSKDKRPHLLMLGGDQIYCDDVPPLFFQHLRRFSKVFAPSGKTSENGPLPPSLKEEQIPDYPDLDFDRMSREKQTGKAPAAKGHSRKDVVTGKANLTSLYLDNHMLLFSEIAASYILAWNASGQLWKGVEDLKAEMHRIYSKDPDLETFLKEAESMGKYREGSIAARKLLANIPTYMMFDDHEVTDDWFITPTWTENVKGTKLGERQLANAISAYWIFQGLGNGSESGLKPMTEDEVIKGNEKLKKFTQAIRKMRTDPKNDQVANLEVLSWNSWSYKTETTPPIIAVDTRTDRVPNDCDHDEVNGSLQYRITKADIIKAKNLKPKPTNPAEGPADLVGPRVYKDIEHVVKDPEQKNLPLVLALATPLFGFEPVEWTQSAMQGIFNKRSAVKAVNLALALNPMFGGPPFGYLRDKVLDLLSDNEFMKKGWSVSPDVSDFEGFRSNPRSLVNMMEKVILAANRKQRTFVLSGDVHYAFIARGDVARRLGGAHKVVQITSSAIKNSPVTGFTRLESSWDDDELAKIVPKFGYLLPGVGKKSEWYWWVTPNGQPLHIKESPEPIPSLAEPTFTFRTKYKLVPMTATTHAGKEAFADESSVITASNMALVHLLEASRSWKWQVQLRVATEDNSTHKTEWVGQPAFFKTP